MTKHNIHQIANQTIMLQLKALGSITKLIDRYYGVDNHNDIAKSANAKFTFLLILLANFKVEDLEMNIPIYTRFLANCDSTNVILGNFIRAKFGDENLVNQILDAKQVKTYQYFIKKMQSLTPTLSTAAASVLLYSALTGKKNISFVLKLLACWSIIAPLLANSSELVPEINNVYQPTQVNFQGLIKTKLQKLARINPEDLPDYDIISAEDVPVENNIDINTKHLLFILKYFIDQREGALELPNAIATELMQKMSSRAWTPSFCMMQSAAGKTFSGISSLTHAARRCIEQHMDGSVVSNQVIAFAKKFNFI